METTNADLVMCRVLVGGQLTSNKGMDLPNASLAIAASRPRTRQDSLTLLWLTVLAGRTLLCALPEEVIAINR